MPSRKATALATLVIRNVEDSLHARLKEHAAAHGHSMEEEVRRILRENIATARTSRSADWVDAIRALFEPLGGLDLPEIERAPPRDPPDFSGPEWGPPA
jgi:plasmid stability protein